jgi:hypothetical protein
MFCPKCATQNLDGQSFCRSCGANISLVPQAMTGKITKASEEPVEEGKRKRRGQVTLEQAFRNVFVGVAFLLVAIALSRSGMGRGWWFWMLLPAFWKMGTGIAQYLRVREAQQASSLDMPPAPRPISEHSRRSDELRPPVASVTEGTTRHLGVEAPTRHLDTHDSK